MEPPKAALALLSIFYALYLLYKLLHFGSRDKRFPPGPPTIPILGNAHQIPPVQFYKKLKEWSDEYGKIFSLKIGGGTIVVLTDRRAVHDLIDKKSAIYSERIFDHNCDVALGGENIATMHANALWRAQRKIASQNLAPKTLDEKVAPVQDAEICQLVHDLLETSDGFFDHIKRVTASAASVVIWGHRAPTSDSWWATSVYRAMEHINTTLEPGTYLPIEQFPILRYIPDRWAPSKARAKRCFETYQSIWLEGRQRVLDRRQNGDERVSLADRVFAGDVKFDVPMTISQTSNFLGALYQGGADTTSNAMLTSILYLAKHPRVQEKAQKELDNVCGAERMPTWTDFKDLPYINCIIKEGLRVRPVVPTNVPHRNKQDDYYEGYLIPKDSTILFPAYGIHHNPAFYPDSEVYNPDRYLKHPRLANDYAGSADYMNRDHYAYGAGRRICVGIHLAERTLWRITASLLWAFKIEPSGDEDLDTGLDAYEGGFLPVPKPFKVTFTPRSEKHVEVIRKDFKNVTGYLAQWE